MLNGNVYDLSDLSQIVAFYRRIQGRNRLCWEMLFTICTDLFIILERIRMLLYWISSEIWEVLRNKWKRVKHKGDSYVIGGIHLCCFQITWINVPLTSSTENIGIILICVIYVLIFGAFILLYAKKLIGIDSYCIMFTIFHCILWNVWRNVPPGDNAWSIALLLESSFVRFQVFASNAAAAAC